MPSPKKSPQSHKSPQPVQAPKARWLIVTLLTLLAVVTAVHAGSLATVVRKWNHDPQYSHGYLVPVFSLLLLWRRRELCRLHQWTPRIWLGAALLIASEGTRVAAAYYGFRWPEAVTYVTSIAGVIVLITGLQGLRWSWPAVAFLLFMIPIPYRLEIAMGYPLQRIATEASTYVLQTLGQPAVAEGNTILLGEVTLGIVEACSGLRMLVVFVALSAAICLLIPNPFAEKVLIMLSAVPIALATNVIRITVTGLLHVYTNTELANLIFHDLAGWLMMPCALAFLLLELAILKRLWIEVKERPAAPPLAA